MKAEMELLGELLLGGIRAGIRHYTVTDTRLSEQYTFNTVAPETLEAIEAELERLCESGHAE